MTLFEVLKKAEECIKALSHRIHSTRYDWNADPDSMTLMESRTVEILQSAIQQWEDVRVLRQDDSAHWYLVPWSAAKRFNEWVEHEAAFSDEVPDYDGPDFSDYRINSPKHLFFIGGCSVDDEKYLPGGTG